MRNQTKIIHYITETFVFTVRTKNYNWDHVQTVALRCWFTGVLYIDTFSSTPKSLQPLQKYHQSKYNSYISHIQTKGVEIADLDIQTQSKDWFIAASGFNAKNLMWNIKCINTAVAVLHNLAAQSDYTLVATDTLTHFLGTLPQT